MEEKQQTLLTGYFLFGQVCDAASSNCLYLMFNIAKNEKSLPLNIYLTYFTYVHITPTAKAELFHPLRQFFRSRANFFHS